MPLKTLMERLDERWDEALAKRAESRYMSFNLEAKTGALMKEGFWIAACGSRGQGVTCKGGTWNGVVGFLKIISDDP